MSVRTIAAKYMELCNALKHFDFMHAYYSPDMVSVEADGTEYAGKEKVIKKSETFQANHNLHRQEIRGPFFNGDGNANSGRFAIHTTLEYSAKSGGPRRTLEEVGVYTIKNDIVTREEFFYDGSFI